MKRIIPLLSLFMCILLMSGAAWGATWYVDGWNGDDSNGGTNIENDAFETIRRGLNRCSNGDTINLVGEFAEAPWDTLWDANGNDWDKDTRTIQISVDKSNLTIHGVEVEGELPVIYGYSPDAPSEHNDYLMRIDNTGNKLEYIKFDGYYDVTDEFVYNHDVIYMTPEADNADITYCDFTNFGYEWHAGAPTYYYFYSIVGGGWTKQNNYLTNVNINNNEFHANEFHAKGAHEIYLSRTSYSEVSDNIIYNNCAGHPLKLRDACNYVTFEDNYVYGAHMCFLGDYPNPQESYSSNTTVKGNRFWDNGSMMADSISYYESLDDHWVYTGPFNNANHITVFENNSIFEFSTDDQRYVHGLTYKEEGTDLFFASKNGTKDEVVVMGNPHAPGPANKYGVTGTNFYCQGDMCTTEGSPDYVIFCTQNSNGQQIVYKDDIDGNFDSSVLFTYASKPNVKVTALTSLGTSTFLSAVRDNDSLSVNIYQSTTSDLMNGVPKLDKTFTFADSITAMAYDGSDIVFATYKNGTSNIYSGTINNLNNPTLRASSITGYIPAMCFAKNNLITALHNGATRRIYYGSITNPLNSYDSLSSKKVIALAGNDDYIYTLIHDDSGGNNRKKIYFSDNLANIEEEVFFYSQWYLWY